MGGEKEQEQVSFTASRLREHQRALTLGKNSCSFRTSWRPSLDRQGLTGRVHLTPVRQSQPLVPVGTKAQNAVLSYTYEMTSSHSNQ